MGRDRHSRRRPLRTIPILLVAVVLCGCGTAVSSATGASSHRTPAAPVVLLAIHMVTPRVGWGLSLHAILRTADGGHTWRVSRSLPGSGEFLGSDLVARDARHAWVLASSRVLSTGDAGHHWRISSPLNGYPAPGRGITFGLPDMSFAGAQDGWILTSGGAAAGSAQYNLYHTTDGGASWMRIAANNLRTQTSQGGLPTCDCLGGTAFRNARVGWLTGSPFAVAGQLVLYRTTSAGTTWRPQSLPLPGGFRQVNVSTAPPAFFGAEGVLPVAFTQPGAFVLYRSRDGGATWQATTPIRAPGKQTDADAFALSPTHVWVWLGLALYQTADGGQHWRRVAGDLSIHGVPELQFLTPSLGFAINAYPGGGKGWTYLLKTADGGQTWQKVPALLVR